MNQSVSEQTVTIGVSVPLNFLAEFDETVKKVGMNRSEAIRYGMRLVLAQLKKGR